jgi:uncharacterized membrane protein YbaN (DUF454 family)
MLPTPKFRTTARRSIGILCLTLGVAGVLLPVLPGWPLLLVSGRILGPRDPLLRRSLLVGHRAVRRLRRAERPFLRRAATRLTPRWRQLARLLIG